MFVHFFSISFEWCQFNFNLISYAGYNNAIKLITDPVNDEKKNSPEKKKTLKDILQLHLCKSRIGILRYGADLKAVQ
jgi:hypothetical protein